MSCYKSALYTGSIVLMLWPLSAWAGNTELELSKTAASKFADVNEAIAAGYTQLFECTVNPNDDNRGSMGIHFINGELASDAQIDLEKPEVLMYEPRDDGALELVSLEYVIFEHALEGQKPPEVLGQRMKKKNAVGVHGVDPFYELHVWHWRENPEGLFADWNTRVSCVHDTTA